MDTQESRPRPLHITSIMIHLDQDVEDVVAEEAGRQALHACRIPSNVDGEWSWDIRPVPGGVLLTPISLDCLAEA